MCIAVLSLGSNMGDRFAMIKAIAGLLQQVLDPPIAVSRLIETEPVDVNESQEWYLNLVIAGSYRFDIFQLLQECQKIENDLGRKRPYIKAPRTADIDILLFGDTQLVSEKITVPHLGLKSRRFCLEGLNDVAPSLVIPGIGKTAQELLTEGTSELLSQIIRFVNKDV